MRLEQNDPGDVLSDDDDFLVNRLNNKDENIDYSNSSFLMPAADGQDLDTPSVRSELSSPIKMFGFRNQQLSPSKRDK